MKISNSLGLLNFNLTDIFENGSEDLKNLNVRESVIKTFERCLLTFWKKYLFTNVHAIELSDISIMFNQNTTVDLNKSNKTPEQIENENPILVINYLIKLDPRISQNGKMIYKLIDIINATIFNTEINFYKNAIDMSSFSKNLTISTLASSQISCKFYLNIEHKRKREN